MQSFLQAISGGQVNWDAVAALSGVFSALLVLFSFLFLASQIREARRATIGQSFLGIVNIVQDQEMREVRGRVFALRGKPLAEWTEAQVAEAERVCQSYDVFGMLCRYRLLPTRMIVDSWGDSIMRAWETCAPYVKKLRDERAAPEFWDDFQWLYKRAKRLRWHRALFRRRRA